MDVERDLGELLFVWVCQEAWLWFQGRSRVDFGVFEVEVVKYVQELGSGSWFPIISRDSVETRDEMGD